MKGDDLVPRSEQLATEVAADEAGGSGHRASHGDDELPGISGEG